MIIRNKFNGYVNGNNRLYPGGGGPTQTTSYQTNIPEYAEPYVTTMLGATEKQVYKYGPNGKITGFQPYKSYTDYDRARGGTGETVAGFTPMQTGAMRGIQNYQLPGQTQAASQLAGYSGLGSLGAGQQYQQMATDPSSIQAYMSPYMEGALQPQLREAARQSAIQGQQGQAQAVGQGAFGGSRSALVEAERQRNLGQLQSDIYGKGMQDAFQSAQQAQQFGADLGLKGYGQAGEMASTLGGLGQQQYGQELGLLGKQMEIGTQQQQYEQQRLNQIIQDYATSQQYPLMQLGVLSNMLRGLPMQAATTQMYQAQPNWLSQGMGGIGTGMALYNQAKQAGYNVAEGGHITEEGVKKYAKGGITGEYAVADIVSKLSDAQLNAQLQNPNAPPEVKEAAAKEAQRRAEMRGMAGGGIIAFKDGKVVTDNAPESRADDPEWKKFYASQASDAKTEPIPNQDADITSTKVVPEFGQRSSIEKLDYGRLSPKERNDLMLGHLTDEQAQNMGYRNAYEYMLAAGPNENIFERTDKQVIDPKFYTSTRFNKSSGNAPKKEASKAKASKEPPQGIVSGAARDKVNEGILSALQKNPVSGSGKERGAVAPVEALATEPAVSTDNQGTSGLETLPSGVKGILAGTTTAPAPAPTPDVTLSPAEKALANYAATQAEIKDRTPEQQADITRKQREALGIVSPYEAESKLVEEKKAKIEAGAKGEFMDRLSEFLMTWGSLPGPALVAANQAGRQFIANSIADKKERKRLLDGLDASLSDIRKAQYLEKLGDHKEAVATIERAGKTFFEVNEKIREGDLKRFEIQGAIDRTVATLHSEEARAAAKLQMEKALKEMEVNKRTDFMNQVEMRVKAMVKEGAPNDASTVNKAMTDILELVKGTDANMAKALAAITTSTAALSNVAINQQNAETRAREQETHKAEGLRKLEKDLAADIENATVYGVSKENKAALRNARDKDASAGIDISNPKSAERAERNRIINEVKAKPAYKPLFESQAAPPAASPKKEDKKGGGVPPPPSGFKAD